MNAFCKDHWERDHSWHHRLVEVDEGGVCFFNLRYDVGGDRIDDLRVNGEG